uniref:Uncharacterized protein n=1 Tax=Anguilla anguilla TaxID=7936 RepID=A0A0E9RXH4_ANGAN
MSITHVNGCWNHQWGERLHEPLNGRSHCWLNEAQAKSRLCSPL